MEQVLADPGIRLKLAMLVVLVFVLFKPIKSIILGTRSKHWRRARAIVTTSDLDREAGHYHPKIIYSYTVNGRDRIDDNYTFSGAITGSKSRAIAIVQELPVGKEIPIYVDPEDASRSVVVPGVHWSAYAGVMFLVIFFSGIAFFAEILNFIWPGCQPHCR